MWKQLRDILLVFGVECVFRIARYLWRVRFVNEPKSAAGPQLYAHWHGDELLLVPLFASRGYAVMASRSNDGEIMARLLKRLGYWVVRGSSSRGGAGGLKGLVDALRIEKRSAAVAVDGPRGPLHKAKPGIFFLAESSGLPIIPAAGAARSSWQIPGAWNQSFFPKPFTRCEVVFGEPIHVPAGCTDSQRESLQRQLEQALHQLKNRAVKATVSKSLYFRRNWRSGCHEVE